MAPRAKTPPSKATKSKNSAAPKPKTTRSGAARTKSAKSDPSPAKKSTPKVTKTIKKKKASLAAVNPPEVIEEDVAVLDPQTAPKRSAAKSEKSANGAKSAAVKRGHKPKAHAEPEDPNESLKREEFSKTRDKKSMRQIVKNDDDFEDDDSNDVSPTGRGRNGGKKSVKSRKRSATEEFLEEDSEESEETEDVEILDDLDPFTSTLILDPELSGPPPAPVAPLPPRPKRLAPRLQTCVDCGQQFGWLSMEKVCFACLKRRVAQRKKDEDYSGYGGSDDSGGDDDY